MSRSTHVSNWLAGVDHTWGRRRGTEVDDLEWVRWQLDRLASARLLGPLNPELEDEYESLAHTECLLMLAERAFS